MSKPDFEKLARIHFPDDNPTQLTMRELWKHGYGNCWTEHVEPLQKENDNLLLEVGAKSIENNGLVVENKSLQAVMKSDKDSYERQIYSLNGRIKQLEEQNQFLQAKVKELEEEHQRVLQNWFIAYNDLAQQNQKLREALIWKGINIEKSVYTKESETIKLLEEQNQKLRDQYDKCICVIKKFDPGIISMYDL